MRKLRSRQGLSLAVCLMLILTAIMLVVISVPGIRYLRARSAELGCGTALDTARRQMAADYMGNNSDPSAEDVKKVVAYVMDGWEDLCPGGGNIYIIASEDTGMPYELVCGLHDKDTARRTRLNASWVLDRLQEMLKDSKEAGHAVPDELELVLNGRSCKVLRVEAPTGLRRGTGATTGYTGTVIFFGLAGYGDFESDQSDSSQEPARGTICYLSFADDAHCANWSVWDGWTGDAYGE